MALGLSLDGVLDLPARELDRWHRYWCEEPWGAWRDNYHTAMLIGETLRPHLKDPSAEIDITAYMLEPPHVVKARKAANLAKMALYMEAQARAEERRRNRPKAHKPPAPSRGKKR